MSSACSAASNTVPLIDQPSQPPVLCSAVPPISTDDQRARRAIVCLTPRYALEWMFMVMVMFWRHIIVCSGSITIPSTIVPAMPNGPHSSTTNRPAMHPSLASMVWLS